KTGTLTRGELRVARCIPLASSSEEQCLRTAALIEQSSEHPLARAFAPFHGDGTVDDVETVPGRGVQARVNGRLFRIGSPDFVAELRKAPTVPQSPGELTGSVVMLGDEHQALAWFELTDSLRPMAAQAV